MSVGMPVLVLGAESVKSFRAAQKRELEQEPPG